MTRLEMNTIHNTSKAWQVLCVRAKSPMYAPALPLQFHPDISVTQEPKSLDILAKARLDTMGDLFREGMFLTQDEFSATQPKTLLTVFTYIRIRAALRLLYSQFADEPNTFEALQMMLTTSLCKHLVTQLYNAAHREAKDEPGAAFSRWNAMLDPPTTPAQENW